MNAVEQFRRMWAHSEWADERLFDALRAAPGVANAWTEYEHILAADAVWLTRLEGRNDAPALWETRTPEDVSALRERVSTGFRGYLERLTPDGLDEMIAYRNTAGKSFETAVRDILLQVMLHGQYHRGKVNLLLRQNEAQPAPADYIAFVRGTPAATSPRA